VTCDVYPVAVEVYWDRPPPPWRSPRSTHPDVARSRLVRGLARHVHPPQSRLRSPTDGDPKLSARATACSAAGRWSLSNGAVRGLFPRRPRRRLPRGYWLLAAGMLLAAAGIRPGAARPYERPYRSRPE